MSGMDGASKPKKVLQPRSPEVEFNGEARSQKNRCVRNRKFPKNACATEERGKLDCWEVDSGDGNSSSSPVIGGLLTHTPKISNKRPRTSAKLHLFNQLGWGLKS